MYFLFLGHIIRKYSDNTLTFKFINFKTNKKITRICEVPEVFKKPLVCYLTEMEIKLIHYSYSKGVWSQISCFFGVFSHLLLFTTSQEQTKQPHTCCVHFSVCAFPHAECRAHTAHFHTAWCLKIKTNEHWGHSKEKNQMWREGWIRSRDGSSSQGPTRPANTPSQIH